MADLVAHMAERLKDGADGKPLKFKQSTVSNLVEFLSNFSFRNVTDDHQLQSLVGRARDLLQGVAVDDLRTSGDMRMRVQQGMAALAADLDGMLVKAGGRKMRLTEEESVQSAPRIAMRLAASGKGVRRTGALGGRSPD
jgi:hypothetical protein